jgi:hypothetical protein
MIAKPLATSGSYPSQWVEVPEQSPSIDVGKVLDAQPVFVTLISMNALAESDEFDSDHLRPTDAALDYARDLVARAALGHKSIPSVAATGDGGIFIEWGNPQSSIVRLIVKPQSVGSYIYLQDGRTQGTIRPATALRLEASLRDIDDATS